VPAKAKPRRRSKRGKKRGASRRGLLFRVAAAGIILATLGLATFFGFYLAYKVQLPPLDDMDTYRHDALQTVKVYARGGELIDERFVEHRSLVTLGDLPEHVAHAVLAAEDRNFYAHEGVDFAGIARALWKDITLGRFAHGGSTITQQLAKTLFLSPERSLARKWKELIFAKELERRFSKDDILSLYLNQIYFGSGAWGIEEAAQRYFGRAARQLTVAQAATLAGLIRSPNRLSPLRNPGAAEARRNDILQAMRRSAWLDKETYDAARDEVLRVSPSSQPWLGVAPYAAAEVWRELKTLFPGQDLMTSGLSVYTTLDADAQVAATEALPDVLRRLDKRLDVVAGEDEKPTIALKNEFTGRILSVDGARTRTPTLRVSVQGKTVRVDQVALARYRDLLPRATTRSKEDRSKGEGARLRAGQWLRLTRLDETRAGKAATRWVPELGPQLAFLALDAQGGGVQVMIGGDDFALHPFNRATRALRPIGSTIKPFIAAIGLAEGSFSETERFTNKRLSFRGAAGARWVPRNYKGGYDGEDYLVEEALMDSINTVAVQMLSRIGVKTVVAALEAIGFSKPIPKDLSLALGSNGERLSGLVAHYASFATGGERPEPYLIERVVSREGQVLYQHASETRRVLPRPVARSVARMLRRVVAEGTGRAAQVDGVAVGGKTGTTNKGRNSWFIGFCGTISAGVWVGYDDNRPAPGATGGGVAATAWSSLIGDLCARP
jgi:penicillin-binding protein 1A